MTQCDNLEDLKLQLSATEYGNFLSNVSVPLSTSLIQDKAFNKLIDEFRYIRSQAVDPLAKVMDYISYGYMIDNVALMITGTVHERDRQEILDRCHPLGWFDALPAISVATDVQALYDTVLVDTPLAPYFKDCFEAADELDDLNIEIIRNRLYRAYLKDFYSVAEELGEDGLKRLLEFEADRRAINIAINSIGTGLSKEERKKLIPELGSLYPVATDLLASAEDVEQVRYAVESSGSSTVGNGDMFDQSNNKSLEDFFYQKEMEICKGVFTQQFTYSTVWAWIKTREQEVRNITWIAECISQNQKERIHNYISVF